MNASRSVLPVAALLSLLILPARADTHAMVEEAHHDLQKALNPGGDRPSDADRTADLKAALEIIKDLPKSRNPRPRFYAMRSLKAALKEIAEGDSSQATADIRDADSSIRDME